MDLETWTAVDAYFDGHLLTSDAALEYALRESEATGLPLFNVAPNQGKLLQILARMQGARKILELGTLAGYSTIWLARALPQDGKLVTIEINPHYAATAATSLAMAGLSHLVDLRIGKATDVLASLYQEGIGPFDFIFIDADKQGYPEYLEWSLKLSRPGTVIFADNVVRQGRVTDPGDTDARVIGVRRFTDLLDGNPRLSATALQTVGNKGYDGFILAIVHE